MHVGLLVAGGGGAINALMKLSGNFEAGRNTLKRKTS